MSHPYALISEVKSTFSELLSLYLEDSPSSPSEAARMGVIGGWSPASVPFLGRFNPVESRAFT